jgi:hypothetical protein
MIARIAYARRRPDEPGRREIVRVTSALVLGRIGIEERVANL